MTGLLTVVFVMVVMGAAPALIAWLIWRSIKKSKALGGLDLAALQALVAQARSLQAADRRGVARIASAANAAPPVASAGASTGDPVVEMRSVGRGKSMVAYLFSTLGLIAAIVAAVTGIRQIEFLQGAVRTDGEVVGNASSGGNNPAFYPRVQFQASDGSVIEFSGDIGNRPPQFDVGEHVGVVYPPARPHDAQIDQWVQLWFGPLLAGFFTLVFSGVGVASLIPALRQRWRARWARAHGLQSFARFSGVTRDTSVKVNDRYPIKVFAEWRNPVDGKLYRFQAQQVLWEDPSPWLRLHPDLPLRVDPQDPRRYWIDLATAMRASPGAPSR